MMRKSLGLWVDEGHESYDTDDLMEAGMRKQSREWQNGTSVNVFSNALLNDESLKQATTLFV